MNDQDAVLADRLNAEPVIFRGCSSSELGVIVVIAAVFWLPVSLLLTGLMGAITMGFGLAGIGVVLTVLPLSIRRQPVPAFQAQPPGRLLPADHSIVAARPRAAPKPVRAV